MSITARSLAAAAALAQLGAAFLAWTADGVVGLDVALPVVGTVAVALVAASALPLVALLVSDVGWPRVVSATMTSALVLVHLSRHAQRGVSIGVAVAIAACVGHWLSAALAEGRA